MGSFLLSVISGVLGGLCLWVALGWGVWLSAAIGRTRHLRRLGFRKRGSNRIVVFVSRIDIPPFTAKPDHYDQTMADPAVTIAEGEFEELATLSQYLMEGEGYFVPELVEGLVDKLFSGFRPELVFATAPEDRHACRWIDSDSNVTICVGSSKRNYATLLYMKTNASEMDFKPEASSMGFDVGYLEKMVFGKDNGRTVFIMGGLGINGTRAAIRYFASGIPNRQHRVDQPYRIRLVCADHGQNEKGYENYCLVGEDEDVNHAWLRFGQASAPKAAPRVAEHGNGQTKRHEPPGQLRSEPVGQ